MDNPVRFLPRCVFAALSFAAGPPVAAEIFRRPLFRPKWGMRETSKASRRSNFSTETWIGDETTLDDIGAKSCAGFLGDVVGGSLPSRPIPKNIELVQSHPRRPSFRRMHSAAPVGTKHPRWSRTRHQLTTFALDTVETADKAYGSARIPPTLLSIARKSSAPAGVKPSHVKTSWIF